MMNDFFFIDNNRTVVDNAAPADRAKNDIAWHKHFGRD
jgi:hypothetical protein